MVMKLLAILILGILGIVLSACTMTVSIDSLEAGSQTTSSWAKNSASESVSRAGLKLMTSQGSAIALDEIGQGEAIKPFKSKYSKYVN